MTLCLCSRLRLFRHCYSDYDLDIIFRFFSFHLCLYPSQILKCQYVNCFMRILRDIILKMRNLRLQNSSLSVEKWLEIGLRKIFEKFQFFALSSTCTQRSHSIMFPAPHHDWKLFKDYLSNVLIRYPSYFIQFYRQTLVDAISCSIFNFPSIPVELSFPLFDPLAQHRKLSSETLPVITSTSSHSLNLSTSTRKDLSLSSFNVFYATMSLPQQIDEASDLECEVTFDTTIEDDDEHILYPIGGEPSPMTFGVYKRVGRKVHPVSRAFPEDCYVQRQIPEDPLLTLLPLPTNPPDFMPTLKISEDRCKILNVNAKGFY